MSRERVRVCAAASSVASILRPAAVKVRVPSSILSVIAWQSTMAAILGQPGTIWRGDDGAMTVFGDAMTGLLGVTRGEEAEERSLDVEEKDAELKMRSRRRSLRCSRKHAARLAGESEPSR